MIKSAEIFAKEDAILKRKVESRNDLEFYVYWVKNQIKNPEKLESKISEYEIKEIEEEANKKVVWLEKNQEADEKAFKKQKIELEDIIRSISPTFHQYQGNITRHL